jgi:acetophenone carboxylase
MTTPTRRYTVDVDIGGTLTDGLISDGEQTWSVKVDTTPHDFTVCFFDCLRQGAGRIGFDDVTSFLEQVAVIRWSTTIATNVMAERKGPRVGLLVSTGHEEDLYGEGKSVAMGYLVGRENIATIEDPADDEAVLAAVRTLLERGVRRICVSLKGSFDDNSAEVAVKRLVDEHFPDHFLGAVPTLLGSEICRHPDDATRTHMALINAYVHTPLAMALFKAEDELLAHHRYRRPLYVAHVNGGVARVAKTKGVDTTESGPVFGLVASAYFAHRYGLERVISIDVGGTTTKVGLVLDGHVATAGQGEFLGIPVKTPWILLRSAAIGGGSVAGVRDGKVVVGPESMGAYPGPACYDLGGDNATLSDAFLVAGMLDPKRFLEGRRPLDLSRARGALETHVATPLGVDIEKAASAVVDAALDAIEVTVRRTLEVAGMGAEGFRLFCFGGNGGNVAAPTAERLGIEEAYVFGLGPVLSAFGSSVSPISHVHEEWPHLAISGGNGVVDRLTDIVRAGRDRVERDLEGEGLRPEEANLTLEFTVAVGGGKVPMTITEAVEAPDHAFARASEAGGTTVERVAVRGTFDVPRFEPSWAEPREDRPERFDERYVLGTRAGLYDWDELRAGAIVEGPAVLESGTNTCTVPTRWQISIDGFLNGMLQRA